MESITTSIAGGQCSQPMPEGETRNFRTTLYTFVLSNLKKSLTAEKDIQDLFSCVTSCVNHIPGILVYSSNCDRSGITSDTQQEKADAKAFTRWLLFQLCQLVGKYDSDYMYTQTLGSITSINKIVRENNLAMFKVLTQDLINSISILCDANPDVSSGKCSIHLLPEGLDEPYDQDVLNLTIESLDDLERKDLDRMIHLFLNILEQVLDGLILLQPKLSSSVWILLCHIISDGTLNNIKVAVRCIRILITNGEIPSNNFIYQHSVSVLLSLVEYVYSSMNDIKDFEDTLSLILQNLLMKKGSLLIKEIDYQECASTLCKIRFQAISNLSRVAYDDIIINLADNDDYLVIPWCNILQERSHALNDVEFLSIVKFHLITKEMQTSNYQKWTQTLTWKNVMKQFNNWQLKNDETFLDGLFLTCDMLATVVVLSKNEQHNSECSLILDLIFQFWESIIFNRCTWLKETMCNFYEMVICFCSYLFKLRDWEPLFEDRSLFLAYLISLPWIQEAPNKYYLSFGKFMSNKVLLIAARDYLDGHKSQSLAILALLPSEIVIDWRIFIFKKELGSKDSQLATSALRSLPALLQVLGLSFYDYFDSFFTNMKENADFINILELVPICLQYTCVLFNSTSTIEWCATGVRENTMVSKLSCSKKKHASPDKRLEKLCENIWRFLFIHPNSIVRKGVVNNLPHILVHFDANDVIFDLCLQFLEDECYDNRLLFGKCTTFFTTYFSDSEGSKHHNSFSLRVRSIYARANGSRNISQVETLAIAIATLAKVTENKFLFDFAIIFLLENVHSTNIFARVTATLQLREIAEYKNLSPMQLFVNCCQSISQLIFKLLREAQEKSDNSPLDIIECTVNAFELYDVNYALKQMLPYLLPNLLENMSDEAHQLIILIAEKLQFSLRGMIFNEFKNIFCHLICYSSQDKHNNILTYIMKETEATIDDLLLNHNQSVYNELMLHLVSNREEAIGVLRSLPSRGIKSSSLDSTEMFLGFLAFFDTHIFNPNVSFDNKKLAVQSLTEAFKLMGSKNLSIVFMKAMATLRILLKLTEKSIVPLCCEVWLTFIKILDPVVVGSALNQIVVALLPLVKMHLEGLKEILEYLIIKKKNVFQNYFCDLYCIPDIPEFAHLLSAIRKSLGNPKSNTDLKNMLTPIINGIVHENIDVRTHTMIYLNNLLCQHQELFESLLLDGDSVDMAISQLIEKLMISCKDNDIFTQNLIGKCLGKLGAIDPSRLQIENFQSCTSRKSTTICLTIEENDFIVELLTTLTKAFLGAPDNLVQNCASYAIQEVLLLYEVPNSATKSQTNGGLVWNMLSENIRHNLQLFFHSRFVCEENLNYSKLQGRPIYNSSFGSTFPKWLTTWTEYMISNVMHPKARKLFWVCRKIVRHDIKVALFLLPYVIIYTIQENSPNFVEEVIQEISLVLKTSVDVSATDNELNRMSVQVIFSVIDHLNSWVLVKRLGNSPSRNNLKRCDDTNFQVDHVSTFLERIPKFLLADASFNAKAYARALINIESHIKTEPNSLNDHLSFLLKLYKALDEPDGVAGIAHISQGSSIHDQILSHENSGRHQDALLCYQRALLDNSKDLQLCEGYLQCLMDLDFPQTALVYSMGILSQNPTWERPMKSYQVEAAWKLANWDTLDNYLDSNGPINPTWGYTIGKILSTVSHRDKSCYLKELEICRGDQMLPLIAASLENGSYERTYEYVLRFHMLEEIDQAVDTFLEAGKEDSRIEQVNQLIHQWQFRQQLIRTSKRCLEPILNLRRVLLGMAINNFGLNLSGPIKLEISRLWLHSAKISRRSSQLQPDYSSILSSFIDVLPEVGLEQAKWHWLKGEKEQATCCLNKIIYEMNLPDSSKSIKAKAMLLLTRYSEESGNLESNTIIEMFRESLKLDNKREDSNYFFAIYYDKLLSACGKIEKRPEMVPFVIKYFGLSLKYGCRYVHMSMPRLLSLWLEFGSVVVEADANKNTNTKLTISLRKTLALISAFTKDLPSFLFYTAFSQLISRICHSHPDVFNYLKEIIAKLLVDYPQQALWLMTGVSKSSYAIRAKRCQEIFHRACQLSPQLTTFHSDANKLTDQLVKLCNMPVENGATLRISTHFGNLKKLLENPKIILPCQLSLNVILPSAIPEDSTKYNPFPTSLVYIQRIEDQIEVMQSLQKPKKITIRCSDGKLYSLMCKPKDDLRKDCRLMEFNSMVNKFLMKDPESRRRHLHIRTYAVVPLNEECGIIEWVPNLNGLRGILLDIYKEKNIFVPPTTLKKMAAQKLDSSGRKLDIFKTSFLPLFPPVLSEWFLRTFTDPNLWYVARSSYARTSAVMSMVGYILGLGDRHGENILLDSSCGDTVHVDFNCLFNKGDTFDWPELVPFRLTHNMVDAMGPLGHQGVFRKSCETTLRVMRKEKDTLMSFLKPFIYDPLVEWSHPIRNQARGSPKGESLGQGEITNEMAKVHVQDIESRLKGYVTKTAALKKGQPNPFPLSVEGQVTALIKQATDQGNLSQMYIGWAAYM